jgi:hypothetical protein
MAKNLPRQTCSRGVEVISKLVYRRKIQVTGGKREGTTSVASTI